MSQKRILVAEDEPTSQTLYRETLEAEGYEVLSARTGAEALRIVEKEPIDVLVLDVRMPDMHGLELLEHLRERGRIIPTVLCTAVAKAGQSFEARSYGVQTTLIKPVDLDELRAKVSEALGQAPAGRAATRGTWRHV
jgi:two-component system response regulator (stage 0 sporulation protein F)